MSFSRDADFPISIHAPHARSDYLNDSDNRYDTD